MQSIIMTSDQSLHTLQGFFHNWKKYAPMLDTEIVVCGFQCPSFDIPANFYSIGEMTDYPAKKWTDAFLRVLSEVADDVFLLMLDDYYLMRQVDATAIKMMADYLHQFQNVIKFDVTYERLFADGGGKYNFGWNTYNTLGYLDLIKSDFGTQYHLSLWGGLWRRDLLKKIVVPGESAQQLELNGTHRLQQYGDEMLVLGTRQAPLLHANIIQRGELNQDVMTGLPALRNLTELQELGYV